MPTRIAQNAAAEVFAIETGFDEVLCNNPRNLVRETFESGDLVVFMK
jgi:hypothetical protein